MRMRCPKTQHGRKTEENRIIQETRQEIKNHDTRTPYSTQRCSIDLYKTSQKMTENTGLILAAKPDNERQVKVIKQK